jgi:hypothetical protein
MGKCNESDADPQDKKNKYPSIGKSNRHVSTPAGGDRGGGSRWRLPLETPIVSTFWRPVFGCVGMSLQKLLGRGSYSERFFG